MIFTKSFGYISGTKYNDPRSMNEFLRQLDNTLLEQSGMSRHQIRKEMEGKPPFSTIYRGKDYKSAFNSKSNNSTLTSEESHPKIRSHRRRIGETRVNYPRDVLSESPGKIKNRTSISWIKVGSSNKTKSNRPIVKSSTKLIKIGLGTGIGTGLGYALTRAMSPHYRKRLIKKGLSDKEISKKLETLKYIGTSSGALLGGSIGSAI